MNWNDIRVIPPKMDQDILVLLDSNEVTRGKFLEVNNNPILIAWDEKRTIIADIIGWRPTDAPDAKPVPDSEMDIPAPTQLYNLTPAESITLDHILTEMRGRSYREGQDQGQQHFISMLKQAGHSEAAEFLQEVFDVPF